MNTHCEELPELKHRDGVHTIFLSTKGNNTTEVPEEIIKFLRYVSAGLKESEQDFGSNFVTKLQRSVKWIKRSRSKEREYMVVDEIKKKERREGLEEGIEIGKEAGIEIGKEAGIEIGQSDIVIRLLQKTNDAKQVASLLDMPVEAIEKIAESNNIRF